MLRLVDVACALFEQLPSVSDKKQAQELKTVLLTSCRDASADLDDPCLEQELAEWLSESLALYTPTSSWASVYYLYGYLKGFRHKTMLDSELDPETDDWLRRWVEVHFQSLGE